MFMRMTIICIATLIVCGCKSPDAQPQTSELKYETDNLTDRATMEALDDELVELDNYVNEHIELSLSDLPSCEASSTSSSSQIPPELYKALKKNLIGRDFFARVITAIEKWVEENEHISKRKNPLNKSIYRSVGFFDWSLIPFVGIASSIKVNGVIMGSDKLGHFFADGNENFETYLKNGDLFEALNVGIRNEEGLYGLAADGVKSYGDLASNYSGLLFWISIIGTDHPYIICKDGIYQKARTFTWTDYVNDSWDEGINCSEFRNSGLGSGFEQEVLDEMKRQNLSCPADEESCKNLTTFEFAECFVSPACWNLAHKPTPSCKKYDH